MDNDEQRDYEEEEYNRRMMEEENESEANVMAKAFLLQTHVGDIDGARTVEVVLGNVEDAQTVADSMNNNMRKIMGDGHEEWHVTVDGPYDFTDLRMD